MALGKAFAAFLDDGRICLTNNCAERALRGVALGRKSWLFCGTDRGGQRAAVMFGLIQTAKLNDVVPQAYRVQFWWVSSHEQLWRGVPAVQ